uniref:Uncharacterized protein n=1 Tax=uncultured prokaryote TaxID=198431 RepID=A0A0H5Q593_9ZZZZ|nr:hypothetical protein [uncultured prokaryote]
MWQICYIVYEEVDRERVRMELNLTATTNLQRATIKDANSAQMHNEHDPNVKHSNVQIVKEDTELNRHTVLLNRNELLEQQYGQMIVERNEKTRQRFLDGKIVEREYKERLTNVNQYLNIDGKKPKQALTTCVFTLGNVDTEFQLLDALGFKYERQKIKDSECKLHDRPRLIDPLERKEFANIMNDTYVELAKAINDTSDAGLKVADVWLHMDEGGMPHAHAEIVNMGHTATGKPSYNLNQALGAFNKHFGKDVYTSRSMNKHGKQSKSPNGKIALKEFRRLIDSCIINSFNMALQKRGLDKKLQVNMVRLGKQGGLSMPEFQQLKQLKQVENAHQKTIQNQNKKIEQNNQLLDRQSHVYAQHKKEFANLDTQKNELIKREQSLKAREKAVQDQEESLRHLLNKFIEWAQDALEPLFEKSRKDGYKQRVNEENMNRAIAEHEADVEARFADDLDRQEAENQAFQAQQQQKLRNRRERVKSEQKKAITAQMVNHFATTQELTYDIGAEKADAQTKSVNQQLKRESEKKMDKDDGLEF